MRAVLDEKERVEREWPRDQIPDRMAYGMREIRPGVFGMHLYDTALAERDRAGENMDRWIADHSDELLAIALGSDGDVERVAKAIRLAHDTTGGHDPYECCADDEECRLFAEVAITALRSGV